MSATVVNDLTPESAQVFEASVDSIETTAIDSLNGFVYYSIFSTVSIQYVYVYVYAGIFF